MNTPIILFVPLVFLAIFLLSQGLVVPAFGEAAHRERRLRRRLAEIEADPRIETQSLLRSKYLEGLSPIERRLEGLPGMLRLRRLVEQAGLEQPAHYVLIQSVLFAALVFTTMLLVRLGVEVAVLAGGLALAMPFLRLGFLRARRLHEIERQLPDAIEVMKRSLKAGHPFVAAMRLVGQDLDAPIGTEFAKTAADLNYGADPRAALVNLLTRVPSLPLMGFVTAILIQRESGGNLAEILDQIANVIRGRYRFQRRVRTLSAEGRMSAWVLTLVPFVLAGILHFSSPDYLRVMFVDPLGMKIFASCAALLLLGVVWMRRIIRIEV